MLNKTNHKETTIYEYITGMSL